jgi:hypothetical protein
VRSPIRRPSLTRRWSARARPTRLRWASAGGITLRDGGFYGAANDGLIKPVRKRQFPIVGIDPGWLLGSPTGPPRH